MFLLVSTIETSFMSRASHALDASYLTPIADLVPSGAGVTVFQSSVPFGFLFTFLHHSRTESTPFPMYPHSRSLATQLCVTEFLAHRKRMTRCSPSVVDPPKNVSLKRQYNLRKLIGLRHPTDDKYMRSEADATLSSNTEISGDTLSADVTHTALLSC